jgi:hypothetical protein
LRLWLLLALLAPCYCGDLNPASPRQIRIPVWADAALRVEDLSARIDEAAASVLRVQGPDDDLMLLIVLDLVGDPSSVEPAKTALLEEIRRMPPRTVVGLLRAQDSLTVLADPTTDRDQLEQAITALPVSGKAGLLNTIEAAGHIADSILCKTTVRVALLYITDSEVANYREDFTNPVINSSDSHDLSRKFPEALVQEKIANLDRALEGQQTPLFLVHLNYRTDRINDAYQNGLKQLAETTAGTAAFCRSSAEIPQAIEKAISLIGAHYSVTLALPVRAGKTVHIELDAEGGIRTLNYRTHFFVRSRAGR